MRALVIALALAATAAGSEAQTPAFDPATWTGSQAGPATQALTLGTPHLAAIPSFSDRRLLSGLLDRLAAFRPDLITAEGVGGTECDLLERYPTVYPDSFETWCRSPALAQAAIGLDGPAATAEVGKTLLAWPARPTAAERRHLAALFLAAGETPSALVQWLRLPPAERRVGDGVTLATLPLLNRVGAKPNETFDVAVELAVRLGLERVYLVDDHTSDAALSDTGVAFGKAVQSAWRASGSSLHDEEQAMEAALKTSDDVVSLYRFLNRPANMRRAVEADFHANLRYPTPQLYGRQYVAGWEVRNLRMVSNVLASVASRPGARILNIVGASHKPYYDAYLKLIPDVTLVDAEDLLNAP